MKREDIEQLNILVPYCFETDLEDNEKDVLNRLYYSNKTLEE